VLVISDMFAYLVFCKVDLVTGNQVGSSLPKSRVGKISRKSSVGKKAVCDDHSELRLIKLRLGSLIP